MKIKGLKRKISFVVIIPLLIGILLTFASSLLPFYLYYPKILDNYTDKMIDTQRETLLKHSSLISNATSVSYIQDIANGVNVISDIIELYLFYGIDVKKSLNYSQIYQNYTDFNPQRIASNTTDKTFYNISVWYASQNWSNLNVQTNLNTSSLFYCIIESAVSIKNIVGSPFKTSYITYQNNGLYFEYPSQYINTTENLCVLSNNTNVNTGKSVFSYDCTNISNCTQCSYCLNTTDNYFEPRCQMYYNYTYNQKVNEVVITTPYILPNTQQLGQTLCRGQWNFTTTQLVLVYCMDFLLDDLLMGELINLANNKQTYSYILDVQGNVLDYKNSETLTNDLDNIYDLEFGTENSHEAKQYKKSILPLFENQISEVKDYEKDGETMMIAVTPILMILGEDTKPVHVASTGVVMKKSSLESKFNSLKSGCNDILLINMYIDIGLLVFIAIVSATWAHRITGSIVSPIDHLLKILVRMYNGDLEIDIMESYQPSSPEVACLYQVFDELRVVKRFKQEKVKEMTEATLINSQALSLFKKFGNKKGMEVCYTKLGYIFYKRELWDESVECLSKARLLSEENINTDIFAHAKLKVDLANAMVKAKSSKEEVLMLFGSSIEIFKKHSKHEDFLPCLLDLAEALYETKDINSNIFMFIEEQLNNFYLSDKPILMQKFLLIKALHFKNTGKFQDACKYLVSVLEDFTVYLPSIRNKAIEILNEIFKLHIKSPPNLKKYIFKGSTKKDIVLILSNNLAEGPVSWAIGRFFKSVLKSNDRMSMIQFSSKCRVIFNLTKLPSNDLTIEKFEDDSFECLLYDSIMIATRQLSLNGFGNKSADKREEWIIIITDYDDIGSKATLEKVCSTLNRNNAKVIIASLAFRNSNIEELANNADNGTIFYMKTQEQAELTFREIEAFMCPEKEVYLPV
ncbi:hypothetical protein SteCoe_7541 [Stentor coeruleus]|uniref:VWFA domain-containing protein n=1 Tax=Stentor coeruleus TaxID=5963 RepID=A0A1R2CMB3_9CILI|nr:hypothetical protein SteCoe_7541 [Stentor coeruleus]